jgi:hypothetical protein
MNKIVKEQIKKRIVIFLQLQAKINSHCISKEGAEIN